MPAVIRGHFAVSGIAILDRLVFPSGNFGKLNRLHTDHADEYLVIGVEPDGVDLLHDFLQRLVGKEGIPRLSPFDLFPRTVRPLLVKFDREVCLHEIRAEDLVILLEQTDDVRGRQIVVEGMPCPMPEQRNMGNVSAMIATAVALQLAVVLGHLIGVVLVVLLLKVLAFMTTNQDKHRSILLCHSELLFELRTDKNLLLSYSYSGFVSIQPESVKSDVYLRYTTITIRMGFKACGSVLEILTEGKLGQLKKLSSYDYLHHTKKHTSQTITRNHQG